MIKVVENYIKILTNKNYSNRTIETYVCYLEKFLNELQKNPYHITLLDIKTTMIYTHVSLKHLKNIKPIL